MSKSHPAATLESLVDDLRQLGVADGDTLFVHASFKAVGPTDDGAATIVAALTTAVGPNGLLAMPSFNLQGDGDERAARWDHSSTPSSVGWLTEFFRQQSGTVRSDHYSHSVAASGHDAQWLVNGHREMTGPISPWDRDEWGRTYGAQSPMLRIYARPNAKILMLGVGYDSSTYQHVVEVLDWNARLADDPDAAFYTYKPRETLGEYWESQGRFCRGNVGLADCRLYAVADYVDTLLTEVKRAPATYCPWHPDNY